MIYNIKVTDKDIMEYIGMDAGKFYREKKKFPKMIEAVRYKIAAIKMMGQ